MDICTPHRTAKHRQPGDETSCKLLFKKAFAFQQS